MRKSIRKLNLRWLAGLILGTILFGGLAYLLHEFQMKRNASVFVREAKRAQSEDRPEDAAVHLRRYTKLDPEDTEGLILYGFQLADLKRNQPAYMALEDAIRREPNRADVRRRLVDLSIKVGRIQDAKDHLEKHLLKAAPHDRELLELLAACQIAEQDFKGAETNLRKAIESSPDHVDTYLQLAQLQDEKLERTKEANDSINEMVDRNPENPSAYLNRGLWRERQLSRLISPKKGGIAVGDQDRATLQEEILSDVKQCLTRAPENADAILLGYRASMYSGKRDEANDFIQNGIKTNPSDVRFYGALADMEAGSGDLEAATKALSRGAAAEPKNMDLKWTLANRLIELPDDKTAQEIILQLRAAKYPEPAIGYLEAKTLVRQQDWAAAIAKLEKIRPDLRNRPNLAKQVDLWLSIAFRETNSPDQQLAAVRRALIWDPDWAQAKLLLAESLAATNNTQEAVSEFRQICAKPGAPLSAMLGLERSLIQLNKSRVPSQRNWTEFDENLKQIEKSESEAVQVAILRMQQKLVDEKIEEAESVIELAREKKPNEIELWNLQFELAQARRDATKIDSLIQAAEKQFGDTVMVRVWKGRSVAQRESADVARELLRVLSQPGADWKREQQLQLASEFAPLFLSVGDFEESEKLASLVESVQPNNLSIRLLLLDIGKRSKNTKLMERVLDEIRTSSGEGAIWHYGEAHRLTLKADDVNDQKNVAEAISHLEKASVMRPTWDRVQTLWAEILDRQGDLKAATEHYLEAIRLGERSKQITNRVMYLLLKANRNDEADRLIRSLRDSQSPLSDELAKTEIDLAIKTDRKDQALKLIKELIQTSKSAADPMWLGQAYFRLDKYDEAAEQFQTVVEANKKSPGPWVALIESLVRSRQRDKAAAAIEQAKLEITGDMAALAIAQSYEIFGDLENARDAYRIAMEKSPENFEIRRRWVNFLLKPETALEAENSIRDILKEASGSDEAQEAIRQWAQQSLIRSLWIQGSREKLDEAIRLVDAQLEKSGSNALDNLRMKANLLAKFPTREKRQQSIDILEKVVAQEPVSPVQIEDRWLLASLYRLIGESTKSRSELRKLIQTRKDDLRFLRAYIQLSLQAGETTEAELYLSSLKKGAPDDPLTMELEIQALYERKKYSEIKKLLNSIVERADRGNVSPNIAVSSKFWSARQYESVARKLAQIAQSDESDRFNAEAEAIYTKLIDQRPDDVLLIAEFLAETAQVDRSLNLLEEHPDELNFARLSRVIRTVMKNPRATPEQLSRLQNLLKSREASFNDPISFSLLSADLMNWRGDYRASSETYRDLINRDKNNVIALNNLAVLLAQTGGNHNEALRLIERAIEIGGPMDALLDTRGLVHLAAGHSDLAVVDFERALLENENAERCFHVAVANARLQKDKEALKFLNRAYALGLDTQELHPTERVILRKLRAELNLPENPS